MSAPRDVMEIFLQPGDVYFGDRKTRMRTLLGSCVSFTLWHPGLLLGGMCHFMLPRRQRRLSQNLDGRYGDEALEMLNLEVRASGTLPADYEVKVIGGGGMFSGRPVRRMQGEEVGEQNARAALALAARHGYQIKAQHLGGVGHRSVIFEVWSGDVWIKHSVGALDLACGEAASA